MNEYNLIVWYRYVVNGEQEKDFKDFKIKANSLQEAMEEALESFRSKLAIPFKIETI